ncbi:MAG: hypothetical protein IPH55_11840 [Betaproteobacteria bacterium]|nr:hypothetical protein [Betaproteobacteria bacterium]
MQRLISSISTDCAPQTVAGRLQEPHAGAVGLRVREADQVVEGDEAGVVVPVLEAESLRQRVEQVGLAGARRADQEQRVFGDQSGQDDRLDGVEAIDAQAGQARKCGCLHSGSPL